MKKKIYSNILLLIVTIAFSFLITETVFRMAHHPKSNLSLITGTTIHTLCLEKDETLDIKKFCEKSPPSRGFLKEIQKRFQKEKTNNTFRIIILGDSFTEGSGVESIEQTYPYKLEDLLNKNSKSLIYEVYSLGIGGYNTHQELVLLEELGLQYNPNLVILQYHPTDIEITTELFNIDGHNLLLDPNKQFVLIDQELTPTALPFSLETNKLLLDNSYFLRFLNKKLYNIYQNFPTNSKLYNENSKKLSFDSLKKINEILKKRNVPLILIFVSGANEGRCTNSSSTIPLKLEVEDIAIKKDIHFIDLCKYIGTYPFSEVKSKNDCPVCDHYNEKGYQIMAETLFENMQKLGFV